MKRAIHIFLALLMFTCISCGGAQKRIVGDGYEITEVKFEGVTRFSGGFILDYIHAGETTWIPFSPDYEHDSGLLLADARRIEALYHAYGYYEAAVLNVEPRFNEKDREATVIFQIYEGRPTTIAKRQFAWTGRPDEAQDIEAEVAVNVGDNFEIGRFNEAQGMIRLELMKLGYPLALVRGSSTVDRKARTADITFQVEPGPHATIGSVKFEGLEYVPEYLCQNEVEFALNEPYSPRRIRQMVNAVKSMRVFRWVAAQPPTEVVDGKVQITIQVSEADKHRLRVGTEIEIDTVRWQEQLRVDYTNTNLFGHLTRLDLRTTGGLAQIPNPFSPDLNGPVLKVRPKFSKKGLLEKHLMWSITPQYKLDLEQGYKYHDLSERFAVSRWFLGWLRLELNHVIRYVNFFEISPTLEANDSLLGRDFRDPYLLSQAGFRAQAFFVDSITKPKNGPIFEVMYGISGKEIASDYGYHKSVAKARAYWTITDWLMLASVAETGVIIPFGSVAGAPFDRKFYLGGANTVRGWGTRRLSPQVEECDENGENCDSVPIGGYTMVRGNLELRWKLFGPIGLVTFFDMGDVQADELTWVTDEWNYSAGPGLRVDTPIGKIRFDVGFRLNDPGVYDEPPLGFYFGFGEAI